MNLDIRKRLAWSVAALVLAGCSSGEQREKRDDRSREDRAKPAVVLMTDFGTKDDAVALLRGVVLSISPGSQVLDLCHDVPAYDIEAGAQILEDAPGIFPAGTVFVCVVDPGVGTARKPIAVLLKNGSYLVGPDNGLLTYAMQRWGTNAVRVIENRAFMRGDVSTTFHGRDVFSPAGAHLALGSPRFEEIGSELKEWKKLERPLRVPVNRIRGHGPVAVVATVVAIDEPYGNLWTNVEPGDLEKLAPGKQLVFSFGEEKSRTNVTVPLVNTFGDVPEGKPLAYWNSRGRLSLAINMGDAARTYGIKRGAQVTVTEE